MTNAELLSFYASIPESPKPIVLQPTYDDPSTPETNEEAEMANGKHDDLRRQWARICGWVAEADWRIGRSEDWAKKQLGLSLSVAHQTGAGLAVSWNPGRGIRYWKKFDSTHRLRINRIGDQLDSLRAVAGALPGFHIINHEHGVLGTPKQIANPKHRATADADVVTTFLRSVVGQMKATFPQSTVVINAEGHWWDQETHAEEVPSNRHIGDMSCCWCYFGNAHMFKRVVEMCNNGQATRVVFPSLWFDQFNAYAGGDNWFDKRTRYFWQTGHLVDYMTLVGKHMAENDSVYGCKILGPNPLNMSHALALKALVKGMVGR